MELACAAHLEGKKVLLGVGLKISSADINQKITGQSIANPVTLSSACLQGLPPTTVQRDKARAAGDPRGLDSIA